MKPVFVLRHIDFEGPGFLETLLEEADVPMRIVAVDKGEPVPSDIADMSGLMLMGGPMSVNDPLPWSALEFELVRSAARSGLPVLGHCLGGQIISKALGGSVSKNPVKEIGWFEVQVKDTVEARTAFGSVTAFEVFHWHGETFSVPDGASPILSSKWCANQGFVHGNILALQCHMEVTADMLPVWTKAYRDEIANPTPSIQTEVEMLRDAALKAAQMQAVTRPMYERWIQTAKDRGGNR